MPETVNPEIIALARTGDSEAIGKIYEHHRVGIYRYLYYRVGDEHVAEDLTSEVFVRMISALEGYRQEAAPFEAWLYQIARNLTIDYLRKMSIRKQTALEEEMVAESGDVTRSVDQKLTSDVLMKALERLNEAQRDVIVLRFVSCLPISQVAAMLHKSEDAIKSLQRRGLETLREVLEEWEVSYVEF